MTADKTLDELIEQINAMPVEDREKIFFILNDNEQLVRQDGKRNIAINKTNGNINITLNKGAPREEIRQIIFEILQAYRFREEPQVKEQPVWLQLLQATATSMAVTGMILFIRQCGWLELMELKSFDWLMRLRPAETVDPRLLVVEATEADVNKYGYPLSDLILAETIQKLTAYGSQTIALNIWREIPREPGHDLLVEEFKNNEKIIALCSVGNPKNIEKPSLGLAKNISIPKQRIGFSDIIEDRDGILRRNLLVIGSVISLPCSARLSLSLRSALHYLYYTHNIYLEWIEEDKVKIGSTVFEELQSDFGGYKNIDDRGYQIFLNYRFNNYRDNVATRVTLADVLEEKVKPESFKDKIVLIGVTARSAKDYVATPYSSADGSFQQEMPGVMVQAQMVSQILSAVLDNRLQIRSWPEWGEALWILLWSIASGAIGWKVKQQQILAVVGLVAIATQVGIAWLLLVAYGFWIPFFPSALALGTTGIATATLSYRKESLDC